MTEGEITGARGYVTGLAYPVQHTPDLDPTRHEAALLIPRLARRDLRRPLRYLELGCGPGFSLAAFAAAQPQGRFVGVDLLPGHIDWLSDLAAEAGLKNLTAVRASFDELDVAALGRFDVVAAHGVWSWVDAETRRRVVDLVGAVLEEQGLFYLSYNCLPGMAAMTPLRELLMLGAGEGDAASRVAAGVALVGEALEAGAAVFADERLRERAEDVLDAPAGYVAHEYFNRDWSAFHHHEAARDLAGAGLAFAGSTRLFDNMDAVRFDERQRALLERLPEGAGRETLRDVITNRTLRTDLFARGRRPVAPKAQAQQFGALRLAAVFRPEQFPHEAPARYRAVLTALDPAPMTCAELAGALGLKGEAAADLPSIVIELMAMELVTVALPKEGLAARQASCAAFNQAVLRRAARGEALPGLVSPVTGGVFEMPVEVMLSAGGEHLRPRLRSLLLL